MTTRVLVSGATGNVGGAAARSLLERGHAVRALVRDPEKPGARALADAGAELFRGDFSDRAACVDAARDMDAVIVVTSPAAGVDLEIELGRAMCESAAKAGAGHVILSSVADAQNATGIPHFDSKAAIETHLQTLGVPWTAVAPVFFYENVLFPWNVAALRDGEYRQALASDVPLKMIGLDTIGAFFAHAVERRQAHAGRHVDIAADALTGPQVAAALSQATGRPVRYVAQDLEEVRDQFEDVAEMYEWFRDVGFSADIPALRAAYPELAWTSFADWARSVDWDAALRLGGPS